MNVDLGDDKSLATKVSRFGMLLSAFLGLPTAYVMLNMTLNKLDNVETQGFETQKLIVQIVQENKEQNRRIEVLEDIVIRNDSTLDQRVGKLEDVIQKGPNP